MSLPQSYSRPLQLERELAAPDNRMDIAPLLDVLLIAFFFSLLGSRFILAPGVQIELPSVSASEISGVPTAAVLTIRSDNMLLFEGHIHTIGSFEAAMRTYFGDKGLADAVLLVKPSKDVSMQTFLYVCEIARRAGFAKVHIAAEVNPEDSMQASPPGLGP